MEAGGRGSILGEHCASLTQGEPGILHGALSYLLQDDDGQVADTHSISAGLDYPGVGPEHAYLRDAGLAEYVSASDDDALAGFQALARTEGIIPALEPAHVIGWLLRRPLARGLVGPGLPLGTRRQGPRHGAGAASGSRRWGGSRLALRARRDAGGRAFVPYVTGGYPGVDAGLLQRLDAAGADAIEVGIPFSDPVMDGGVIQEASAEALRLGRPTDRRPRRRSGRRRSTSRSPS